MKIGLIIQGPVMSWGKLGSSLSTPELELNPESFTQFDSTSLIELTASTAKSLGIEFCVSTWAGNNVDLLNITKSNIIINDPSDRFDVKRSLNSNFGLKVNDNTLRMYFSTLAGVKFLNKLGCDFIVKTRTDLEIDLPTLIEISTRAFMENKILISNGWKQSCYIDDFIIGGSNEFMLRLFTELLEFNFHPHVHRDLFRAVAWQNFRFERDKESNGVVRDSAFFSDDNSDFPTQLRSYEQILWETKFLFLPQDFWSSAKLRGDLISSQWVSSLPIPNSHQKNNKALGYDSVNLLKFFEFEFGSSWKSQIVSNAYEIVRHEIFRRLKEFFRLRF